MHSRTQQSTLLNLLLVSHSTYFVALTVLSISNLNLFSISSFDSFPGVTEPLIWDVHYWDHDLAAVTGPSLKRVSQCLYPCKQTALSAVLRRTFQKHTKRFSGWYVVAGFAKWLQVGMKRLFTFSKGIVRKIARGLFVFVSGGRFAHTGITC